MLTRFILIAFLLTYPALKAGSQSENPLAGDASAIAGGKSLYRWYCSPCHGFAGEGGLRGPDVVRTSTSHSSTDQQLFDVITQGILGTDMPPHVLPDQQVWKLVAYIGDARLKSTARDVSGDWSRGKEIYFGKGFCNNCHMIDGQGGRLGPDLTGIGDKRSVDDLIESIRNPSSTFRTRWVLEIPYGGYDPVRLTRADGTKITGVVKNEDTFTMQVMDRAENIHSFQKGDLEEIQRLPRSLMPPYPQRMISVQELEDLLTFLTRRTDRQPMQ